jgi:hypothetical protein
MSSFTLEHARGLAENTFRFRPDKFETPDQQRWCGEADRPLLGNEKRLLDALRAGEQRYLECKAEIESIRQLRKSDAELPQRCAAITEDLQKATDALSRLDKVSREELNLIALQHDACFDEMYERLESVLSWLGEGADGFFPESNKSQGRKPGVSNGGVQRVPLQEFAKEIRNFLLHPDIGVKFSFEALTREDLDPIVREPISAAARLLYNATRILDHRVGIADVEAVMRAVNRYPDFREELLGDPAIDALTG